MRAIPVILAAMAGVAVGVGVTRWMMHRPTPQAAGAAPASSGADRPVLYWYDPMVPNQHFDRPGKSPFMDMQLVPKFDSGADPNCTVRDVEAATAVEPQP